MSSHQQRLAAITDMQVGVIAAVAHLKSQLSELKNLRELVMAELEIATPEMMERCGRYSSFLSAGKRP